MYLWTYFKKTHFVASGYVTESKNCAVNQHYKFGKVNKRLINGLGGNHPLVGHYRLAIISSLRRI